MTQMNADKGKNMKVITVVLKGDGGGSTVMIDDEPIKGVKSVRVSQDIGEAPRVRIELAAPIVVVKVETDDVEVMPNEGKPE